MPRIGGYNRGPNRALIVVFACDLEAEGRVLGVESIRRVTKAAEVYHSLKKSGARTRIVVSAGFAPNLSDKFPHQKESMARLQALYLKWRGVNDEDILYGGNPLTWGSLAELEAALKIRDLELRHFPGEYPLYLVTSFIHSWRVRHLARNWFGVDDREIFVASVHPSFTVAAIEAVKFPLQLIKLRAEKARGKGPVRQ